MNYTDYQQQYFVNPAPQPRFGFGGLHGITLFFSNYETATAYYQAVLGPPAYVEGDSTKGWPIGNTWLTLLRGTNGNPRNVEVNIVMPTPKDAEKLHAAFVEAGGAGDAPSNQLMYVPIRYCSLKDPLGTNILIWSPLST